MKIANYKNIKIENNNPIFTFSSTGDENWKEWDRFIEIENNKAFHIGNICGTCNFFFEKLEGCVKKESSETLIQALKSSISNDFDELIENLSPLFEGGDYLIINSTIQPVHIIPFSNSDYFSNEIIASYGISEFSGLPFFPKTTYYRDTDFVIDEESKRFDFFIPMIPDTWLNQKTVENYENLIRNGSTPTCISIGVIDIKQPFDWPEEIQFSKHICFANYLIDGHHKIKAASNLGKALNLISFININKGVSTYLDILNALGIEK